MKIYGNASGRIIDVGGTLRVDGDLDLTDELDIGGKAYIEGTLKSRRVDVGGKIEAYRVEASEIRTNTLITQKGATADYIEIGRRGEVEGPLVAKRVTVRNRARVEDIYAEVVELRRGCRVNNVYAARVDVERGCRVRGEVKYTGSLSADRDVEFGRAPEKTEKLPQPPI